MSYLRRRFPLESTSTVYMTGKAVYNLVRWNKPGHIADIELYPADAELFCQAVQEAMAEAWDAGARHGETCEGGLTCDPRTANPYRGGDR